MSAYGAGLRCLQAVVDISAFQADPVNLGIGYKQFLLFHKLSKASETVAVHLFDFSDLVEGECYFGEALFFSRCV